MKNSIKFGIAAAIAVLAIGCDTDYYGDAFTRDTDSGWVEFGDTITQAVNVDRVVIPIFQRSATNSKATEINYSVAAVEGNPPSSFLGDFTVIVPEDELIAELVFNIEPNAEPFKVEITILSTNQDNLILGLEGVEERAHPIRHTFRYCTGAVGTTYSGVPSFNGSSASSFTATLTQVPGQDNVYNIDTAWGMNFVADATGNPAFEGQFVYDGVLTVNPDNTITIVGNDPSYATGGSGVYEPACTGTFTYTLTQALFADPFEVEVVLTEI